MLNVLYKYKTLCAKCNKFTEPKHKNGSYCLNFLLPSQQHCLSRVKPQWTRVDQHPVLTQS